MHEKVSLFKGARNIVLKENSFTVIAGASNLKEGNLDRLVDVVAPNAILNTGGRADEVRCYPGTREEVISKLENWIDDESPEKKRMMWLSGPAGAGKSAIFQTVAERCSEHGRHAANFFFFRGDNTRSHAKPLVATLVYQLRPFYPDLDKLLIGCLTADPLIFSTSIEAQFNTLISLPIQVAQKSCLIHQPIVLIIDGLDECDDKRKQEQILVALRTLANAEHSSFLILIASRAEPHLVMSFNRLGDSVESTFLDNQYRPQDDIRRFVVAKFDEIKRTHHLAETLDKHWPAEVYVNAITNKSSGQFIYAATVIRFIQYSSASPELCLIAVLEMRPSHGHNPLAQLDAVYSYIFSKARDIQMVKFIICMHFMANMSASYSFYKLVQILGHSEIQIKSLFADLGAIIQVETDGSRSLHLTFYHASLEDYLKDKSRSEIYYAAVNEIAVELSPISLRNFYDKHSLSIVIHILGHVEEATPELSKSLLDASRRPLVFCMGFADEWENLIYAIERLYLKRDRAQFKIILQSWVRLAYLNNVDISKDIGHLTASASWYYKWYRATERIKFALRLRHAPSRNDTNFLHDT